jgi:hypothetical protein
MSNLADQVEYIPLAEASPEGFLLTCLYAEFGKRKTTTACSMIKDRGLLVSADNSWKVLKRDIHKDLLDKTDLVLYDGTSQLEVLKYENYDTVIFDTTSKMIDNFLDLVLDEAGWGGKRFREQLSSKRKELNSIEVPGPIDYRVVRDQFRSVLRPVMEAKVHKVFTFHVNDPIEGLSKDMVKRPRIPNSTWSMIAELADIIGMITGDRKGFSISLKENSTTYIGKSRVDGISGEMPLDEFIKNYHLATGGQT